MPDSSRKWEIEDGMTFYLCHALKAMCFSTDMVYYTYKGVYSKGNCSITFALLTYALITLLFFSYTDNYVISMINMKNDSMSPYPLE